MNLRSLLFVPADRPDRIAKALALHADAVILDLEDSVAPASKDTARATVAACLAQTDRTRPIFVRINPLGGAPAEADLHALAGRAPDAIVLPKAEGGADVASLDARLTGAGDADCRILPIVETPASLFALGSFAGCSRRLCGLTWGAVDLGTAVQARSPQAEGGGFTAPFQLARSLTLFAAHAAGVAAIDTVYPAISDAAGLAGYVAEGARDGFGGMLAIHPSQVAVINAGFAPSAAELARAQAIVSAFEANPQAGALQLDGRMIDAPDLLRARRVLGE